MYDNTIEKVPGGSPESKSERTVPPEQDFAKSMSKGVPEFTGFQFGNANETNEFYGEAVDGNAEADEDNEGLSNAAALINYGLDAVAREKGVETVVQGIKGFDTSKSDNPLRDLYIHLGVDTAEELEDTRDESEATRSARARFRSEYSMPKTQKRSREGAVKAIQDMKELIAEVEGADPRYEDLRKQARAYGKGYFEYAVKDFGLKGLTDLFGVLAEQKEQKEQKAQEKPEQLGQPKQPEQQAPTPAEIDKSVETEEPIETNEPNTIDELDGTNKPNETDEPSTADNEDEDKEKDPRILSSQ